MPMHGLGQLMLRATIGGYFFGHGMQKLGGWFGGPGPAGTAQMFEQAGLRPGRENALLAGAADGGRLAARARSVHACGGEHAERRDDERDPARPLAGRALEHEWRNRAPGGDAGRAGAAGAVYVAERGPELYDALANDSDEPLRCARPVARGH